MHGVTNNEITYCKRFLGGGYFKELRGKLEARENPETPGEWTFISGGTITASFRRAAATDPTNKYLKILVRDKLKDVSKIRWTTPDDVVKYRKQVANQFNSGLQGLTMCETLMEATAGSDAWKAHMHLTKIRAEKMPKTGPFTYIASKESFILKNFKRVFGSDMDMFTNALAAKRHLDGLVMFDAYSELAAERADFLAPLAVEVALKNSKDFLGKVVFPDRCAFATCPQDVCPRRSFDAHASSS
jgi:hypothetical protein